jgi:rhamnopyranosyl-N-acetylglucosaminyl-diphospho-decaprenol beta-1,3/1,4-galactofuranosyltransferase
MVCAVIVAAPGARAVLEAVEAQEHAVDGIVVAGPDAEALAEGRHVALDVPAADGPAGALAAGVDTALALGADWVWALDGHAVPAPDVLGTLLSATAFDDLPDASVLAGKVTDAAGELHPDALPWPEIFEKEVSTAACGHRLVSLRAARPGAVLVKADAIRAHGGPRADYVSHGEVLEWTARILRHEAGYLVPAAVAPRADRDRRAVRRDLKNRAAMLRTDSWRREEKLWFGFLLAQDAVRAAAGRA